MHIVIAVLIIFIGYIWHMTADGGTPPQFRKHSESCEALGYEDCEDLH